MSDQKTTITEPMLAAARRAVLREGKPLPDEVYTAIYRAMADAAKEPANAR